MLSRLALGAGCRLVPGLLGSGSRALKPQTGLTQQLSRGFRDVRGRNSNTKRVVDVKPVTGTATGFKGSLKPMEIGQWAVIGSSALGLGALCYYGMGLANEPGAIDKAAMWPQYVRDRVRDTYLYFGASVGVAAASAITLFRSPAGHKFFMLCERHPILSTVGLIAAMIGTGSAMMSVPYSPGLGTKQALWLLNCGVMGLVAAPIGVLGGAIALQAAWYTAGIVGGLSTVAACAPSDKFLNWAGPLGLGLGGVCVASIGTLFVPPTSTFGLSLYSIAIYGGLVLFSAMLLYDTQKVIRRAESHPVANPWAVQQGWAVPAPYDPINASHRIFMDTFHIFIRMAQILALGGGRKK